MPQVECGSRDIQDTGLDECLAGIQTALRRIERPVPHFQLPFFHFQYQRSAGRGRIDLVVVDYHVVGSELHLVQGRVGNIARYRDFHAQAAFAIYV